MGSELSNAYHRLRRQADRSHEYSSAYAYGVAEQALWQFPEQLDSAARNALLDEFQAYEARATDAKEREAWSRIYVLFLAACPA